MKEFDFTEPDLSPEAAHLSYHDLKKYADLIAEVAITIAGIRSMAAGAATKLQTVKIRERGGEYEWDMGQIKKTK